MKDDIKQERENLEELEKRLGFSFYDKKILSIALTHRSYAYEQDLSSDNQRLEFLGDAVLGLVIGEELFRRMPTAQEGCLTRCRASLVCEKSLAEKGRLLGLDHFLAVGKNEYQNCMGIRDSVVADAYEALLAAIYLDRGLAGAREFLKKEFEDLLENPTCIESSDPKTELQEWVQSEPGRTLKYIHIGKEGCDHAPTFTCEAWIDGHCVGIGNGKSKKNAERAAAAMCLQHIRESGNYIIIESRGTEQGDGTDSGVL